MAQGLQNGRVLFASLMLGFRAHTRALVTLSVSLIIAFLCLTGSTLASAHVSEKQAVKSAAQPLLPLEPAHSDLPQTVIRLFFLLPRLLPHDH